jgi:hypothetical protein
MWLEVVQDQDFGRAMSKLHFLLDQHLLVTIRLDAHFSTTSYHTP